jgi:hypothetical protein
MWTLGVRVADLRAKLTANGSFHATTFTPTVGGVGTIKERLHRRFLYRGMPPLRRMNEMRLRSECCRQPQRRPVIKAIDVAG